MFRPLWGHFTMTIQERAELIGYFEKMRDDARSYLRVVPLRDTSREVWEQRAEKCDQAVKALAAVECAA